jgi:hypothetical protein
LNWNKFNLTLLRVFETLLKFSESLLRFIMTLLRFFKTFVQSAVAFLEVEDEVLFAPESSIAS